MRHPSRWRRWLFVPLVGLAAWAAPRSAARAQAPPNAEAVFSNLGPGDSFDDGAGWIVTGPTATTPDFSAWDVGTQFRPQNAYTFEGADLPLTWFQGEKRLQVSLTIDAFSAPYLPLETFEVEYLNHYTPTFVRLRSQTHPLLRAGQAYWLTAHADNDTYAMWNMNSIGNRAPYRERHFGGSWRAISGATAPAFRVWGTRVQPVPEPSALMLLGLGLAPMALVHLRRCATLTSR